MTRGAAWCLAIGMLMPFLAWQIARGPDAAAAPMPVLYTLGGDFTLDSTLERRLSLSDFRGKLVLLNFGYTGCPDVCPTALARMRDALKLADQNGRPVVPLFVTLDPGRDTVDRLTPYVAFFHDELIGLTGSDEEIAAAAESFRVYYRLEADGGPGSYRLSHSSHLYLIDTAGRVRGTFGEGVPVADVAAAIRRLQKEAENQSI